MTVTETAASYNREDEHAFGMSASEAIMATFRAPLGLSVLPIDDAEEWIAIEAYATTVAGWADLVRRVTLEESGARPLVRWVVRDLRVGSTHLDLAPILVAGSGEDVGEAEEVREAVPRIVVAGLERMEAGEDPADVFSPEAAEAARLLVRPLLSERIAHILVHDAEREVPLTRLGAGRHQERPSRFLSIGSVEGELKAVSFSELRPFFSVYRTGGGRAIKCYFNERSHLDQVLALLRQRVLVSGRISRTDDGTPSIVSDVRTIRRLGGSRLPQPADLVGIDPDLTGGVPSEEWLAQRRRG